MKRSLAEADSDLLSWLHALVPRCTVTAAHALRIALKQHCSAWW
jgi:hypothetical protein